MEANVDSQLRKMNDSDIEKKVELPIIEFFLINFICFLFPFYICLGLFLLFEYVFRILFAINLLLHLVLLSFLILFLYYLYILILIEFSAFWVKRWNKKSAPKQGVFKRVLNDLESEEGKILKYYHRRGFIIKFPVWLSSKSPFPWLVNHALRKIGHNKIDENVIYCDNFVGLEFTDIGKNSFFYPTAAISSHAVNTIFGKISIMEIKLGQNTIFYPGVIAGPNAETKSNYIIYPLSVLHKGWRGIPDQRIYSGSPAKPLINEKK
ncbi:MAG: hypothetical protein EU547_05595 [Promethearchaeota archaeon]|nr:MAG: hypothetical protein EU547_05595 [Candidatus Lokiarchaeota archaeon]